MNERTPVTPSDSEGFKFPSQETHKSPKQELEHSPEIKMKASKTWSAAEWKHRQNELKDEPYLAADPALFVSIDHAFFEIERHNHLVRMSERSPDAPIQSVETRLIIHAPSFQNWGNSYHNTRRDGTLERKENAVIEIARQISAHVNGVLENPNIDPTAKQLKIQDVLERENIFGDVVLPVILKGHEGPRGPVYFVQDGSHRVAAAKLVGLDRVYGRVGETLDHQTARVAWYESLALMPEEARNDLRAVYDQVYPPTTQEKKLDEAALEEATSRVAEIRKNIDSLHQKLDDEAQRKYEQAKDVEKRFAEAEKFATHVNDKKRFTRLRQEAGLAYLKDNAPDSLWEEYNQEIDTEGYLTRKDGNMSYTASTGYDTGDSYRQIMINAVAAYQNEFSNEDHEN